jgi:hypothetical protein
MRRWLVDKSLGIIGLGLALTVRSASRRALVKRLLGAAVVGVAGLAAATLRNPTEPRSSAPAAPAAAVTDRGGEIHLRARGDTRQSTAVRISGWAWLGVLVLWVSAAGALLAGRSAVWSLKLTYLDLFQALPTTYWLSLTVGTIVGVLTLWKAQTEPWIVACVTGITFLYGPSFVLGLYPGISGWDAYLHSAPTVSLLAGRGIPPTNNYAGQYPGPPTLLASFAHTLNVEPVVAAVIVTVLVELALVFIFMGIARLFLGVKTSAWASLLVFALTPAIITNEHYSPWLVGYLALWSILLLLLTSLVAREANWWWWMSAALLLGVGATMSHPFLPAIAIALILGLAIWSWRERTGRGGALVALAGVLGAVYAAWTTNVATFYFRVGLSFFRDAAGAPQAAVSSWDQPSILEGIQIAPTSVQAIIVLRWAAYGVPAMLALVGVFSAQRKRVMLLLWLAIVSSSSVVIGFASASPWIQRLVYLAAPLLMLAAIVSVRAWEDRLASRLLGARRWGVLGASGVGIGLSLSLVLWHPPDLIYGVHPMQAAFVVWPQETAAAKYVARNVSEADVVGSDLQTMIIYSYFQPNYPPFQHGVSMGTNLEQRTNRVPTLFEGNWLIRSHRQEISRFQAQGIDNQFWAALDVRLFDAGDRVYDNGFVFVYHLKSVS